jgi:hypothetical protein
MKSKEEVIKEFWDQDRQFTQLIKKYEGNDELLGEADYLYQQGVKVSEIERTLDEGVKVNRSPEVAELLNEDRRFEELKNSYRGDAAALDKAESLKSLGVSVEIIEKIIKEEL